MNAVQEVVQTGAARAFPARDVGELLELIPQEAAVNQGLVRHVGEVTLVSCRDFTDDDAGRLARLSPVEYATLLLASEPMSYEAIRTVTKKSISTVRTHLGKVYAKLEVSDKAQAGTFIPIDAARLSGLPPYGTNGESDRPGLGSVLSNREFETFEYLADGLIVKQVAREMSVATSTVRTNSMSICNKLELKGLTELARTAGALRNLDLYWDASGTAATANIVQSNVLHIIQRAERHESASPYSTKLDEKIVHRTFDASLLAELTKGGYLPHTLARRGELDLPGLAAALLMKRPEVRAIMQDRLTRSVVRTVIQKEVSHYLSQHEEAQTADPSTG